VLLPALEQPPDRDQRNRQRSAQRGHRTVHPRLERLQACDAQADRIEFLAPLEAEAGFRLCYAANTDDMNAS
jgi:hypothetical protein